MNERKELFSIDDLIKLAKRIGAEPYYPTEEFLPSYDTKKDRGTIIGELIEEGKVVYIRDQKKGTDYKFHICHCRTIMDFLFNKRYDIRYRAISAKDLLAKSTNSKYKFLANVTMEDGCSTQMYREMQVCRNCLEAIDYVDERERRFNNSSEYVKSQIVKHFDLEHFIEEYIINTPLQTRSYRN